MAYLPLTRRRVSIRDEQTNKLLEAARYMHLEKHNTKLTYEQVIKKALEEHLTKWTIPQKNSKKR
jgi:hypothetical protein